MKSPLLLGALASILAGPAFATNGPPAQHPSAFDDPSNPSYKAPATTVAPVASSLSSATANAKAAARSTSRATGGNATAAGGSATTGPVTVNQSYDGGGGYGRIPVSPAIAPNVTSYNSCAGSAASGGLSLMGVSISFGTGNAFDNACRLHMLGQDRVAFSYLCKVSDDVRQAAKDAGLPCPQDAAPVVQPIAYTPQRATRPDWCENLSDANERRTYANVCERLGPDTQLPRH